MNSRLISRRIVSLMLALVVGLWAEMGLASPSAVDGHGMQCHHSSHVGDQPATGDGEASSPPVSPEEHASSVPCCPMQPESLPPECGDRPCCTVSGEPVRPLAFLVVSGNSLEKELSADGPRTGVVSLPQLGAVIATRMADASLYIQPVSDKKTDLRI
jgi:hypothetical protein